MLLPPYDGIRAEIKLLNCVRVRAMCVRIIEVLTMRPSGDLMLVQSLRTTKIVKSVRLLCRGCNNANDTVVMFSSKFPE